MEENTDLELDTSSVNSRNGVRSSLTDLNGVFVFTDEFQEQMGRVEQEKQQRQSELSDKIFNNSMRENCGDEVIEGLFSGREEQLIVRNDQIDESSHLFIYQAGSLLLIIILFLTGSMMLFKGKGKKKYDVDNKLQSPA